MQLAFGKLSSLQWQSVVSGVEFMVNGENSSMIRTLYKLGRRQAGYLFRRGKFLQTLAVNGLNLDWRKNRSQYHVLRDIFQNREYADYFPFYQTASIVDIGAHYGFFSLFASLNTKSDSKIFSIEPSSTNIQQLMDNIQQSKVTNVTAVCAAIAEKSGTANLRLAAAATNSLVVTAGDDSCLREEVATLTLADLLQRHNIGHVDFMKMDCEGAEYEILENSSDEVLSRIDVISMEFHDRKSAKYNADFLIRRLRSAGFNIMKFYYSPTGLGLNYGKLIASRIH